MQWWSEWLHINNNTYLQLQSLKCVKSRMYSHSGPGKYGIEMAVTPGMVTLSYQATVVIITLGTLPF